MKYICKAGARGERPHGNACDICEHKIPHERLATNTIISWRCRTKKEDMWQENCSCIPISFEMKMREAIKKHEEDKRNSKTA